MDAKLKAKWVEALRGGKFKQARGALCKGDNHLCCIGVGAVVWDNTYKPWPGISTSSAANTLGLSSNQIEALTYMNDYEKRTFKTIADYIEKNL